MRRSRRQALWYGLAWVLLIGSLYANYRLKAIGGSVLFATQATGVIAFVLLVMLGMWTAGIVQRALDRGEDT